MLSLKQAHHFLEDILQLPEGWELILQNFPLEFLRIFMRHYATRIPFQNVTMSAVDPSSRRPPTEEEVISAGLSGKGGCCINFNYFAGLVLSAVGLDSFLIQSTHANAPVAGTHCMLGVRLGPSGGSIYVVELGGAFPILEPVPMSGLPFRITSAAGWPYEFREVEPGLVARFQLDGGLLTGKYLTHSEVMRTSWDLVPKSFSDFEGPNRETFTNPKKSALLRGPMLCRCFYPKEIKMLLEEELSFLGLENKLSSTLGGVGKMVNEHSELFVFAANRTLIIGDVWERRLVKKYDNYEDMAPDICRYFPTLDPVEVGKACDIWAEFTGVSSPYDNL